MGKALQYAGQGTVVNITLVGSKPTGRTSI